MSTPPEERPLEILHERRSIERRVPRNVEFANERRESDRRRPALEPDGHPQRAPITRDEFLNIVSHDLRGPLTTIAGTAALIAQQAHLGDAARIRGWSESILGSVRAMERLIDDLLDFGTFEHGRLRVRAAPHDVREVIAEVAEAFEPVAAAKAVRIAAELPPDPVIAEFDRHRIYQVLSNLVHNAIKFTRDGGSIRVRVTARPGECLVAVADTGIGIPKGELESIFERFRQLDATNRTGLGLGLYISLWIVSAHRGRIWAESDVGDGTTFYFTLPAPA